MSRFLYLMRHAQSADKQPGQADKERELTLKGMQDATLIGRYLHDQKKIPKIFLSSTANRAKTTTQLVCDVLKIENENKNDVLKSLRSENQANSEDVKQLIQGSELYNKLITNIQTENLEQKI